jgi:hypothetical protein
MSSESLVQEQFTYDGYLVSQSLREAARSDGDAEYICDATATELAEAPSPIVFTRTVVITQQHARVMNQRHPGELPRRDELVALLLGISMRYVQTLIDQVNRGFRTIAPAQTLSTHETRSRLGMTDSALQAREGSAPSGG